MSVLLYKGNRLRLTACLCYSWEMALNVGHNISFDSMYYWKEIRKDAGDGNSPQACVTNDETSRWILNGCYTSFYSF
jgi:hypothetical protein